VKIDKRRPLHWLYLFAFATQALLGLLLRPFFNKSGIVLYGHKLNGNLLALSRALPSATFLSMDYNYCRELRSQGIHCRWACTFGAAILLARAKAVISDHGLHSLGTVLPAYRKLGLKCFDVWHGIPFKGFDAADFQLQQQYDEIWVASPLHYDLYVKLYGFSSDKIAITGYARTDVLIQPLQSHTEIRESFNLPQHGALILFAPTWAQDTEDATSFLSALMNESFSAHSRPSQGGTKPLCYYAPTSTVMCQQ